MGINTITQIKFPSFKDPNGILQVYESIEYVPFDIKRVFVVSAKSFNIRGDHAHKKCTQLLICIKGEIQVSCDDGFSVAQYVINDASTGLLVPPGIWAREEYLFDDSILMVLCDRRFEEDDYIRERNEFIEWVERAK